MSWERVAGPGSDPELLRRLVARVHLPSTSPTALRERLMERDCDASPAARLDAVAGAPGAVALAAVDHLAKRWADLDVRLALPGAAGYPQRLARGWPDNGMPLWIAIRGALPTDERPVAAIVGARRASGYGTGVAAWLAEAVAEAGGVVVSGGAVGIDAAAHGAALGQPASTVVVLGCGHGVDYPQQHAAPGGLFDRVLERGGALLSEFPPGAAPRPFRVRERNRIVAGMADAVVVVEGGPRSGSLLTAGAAAELGIQVLAVPGDVRADGSAAPHRLLAEGAAPCTEPGDLLAALGTAAADGGTERSAPSGLPAPVRRVLAERWPRPLRVEELAEEAGVAAGALLAALTRARIGGEVVAGADGVRLSRAP